jgi:chromosome segregation ATPase
VGEFDTDAPTPAEIRERIARLAAQVRGLTEPAEREPPPPAQPPEAPLGQVGDALIAAAERTAAEIRERALAEAARIAGERLGERAAADAAAAGMLERERETLEALAAETARLEEGVEALRTQIAALDSELERLRRR